MHPGHLVVLQGHHAARARWSRHHGHWRTVLDQGQQVPRFRRQAALAGQQDLDEQILQAAQSSEAPMIVMHPDLTPDNLLRTDDGRLVCIDNELVCTGNQPLLDLCNALRPLGQTARDLFAHDWFTQTPLSGSALQRTAMAWSVRETGNAFVTGHLGRCQFLLDSALQNPANLLPFGLESPAA